MLKSKILKWWESSSKAKKQYYIANCIVVAYTILCFIITVANTVSWDPIARMSVAMYALCLALSIYCLSWKWEKSAGKTMLTIAYVLACVSFYATTDEVQLWFSVFNVGLLIVLRVCELFSSFLTISVISIPTLAKWISMCVHGYAQELLVYICSLLIACAVIILSTLFGHAIFTALGRYIGSDDFN